MSDTKPDGARPTLRDDIRVVLGAVETEVEFRDGKKETIKVRVLPGRLSGYWDELRDDEAALVELYCDKFDMIAYDRHKKLSAHERTLILLRTKATDLAEIDKISKEIAELGQKLCQLDVEERWDDRITPESHDEILSIGNQINRPQCDRWEKTARAATDRMREKLASLKPATSPTASSSEKSASS
jgi:hypothetical protein